MCQLVVIENSEGELALSRFSQVSCYQDEFGDTVEMLETAHGLVDAMSLGEYFWQLKLTDPKQNPDLLLEGFSRWEGKIGLYEAIMKHTGQE